VSKTKNSTVQFYSAKIDKEDYMDRQQIDTLVKEMNVDTATGLVDQRVQQIKHITFNFELVKDLNNVPSTEVECRRAST
jgi:catechol 1,2-dioxygenase